jgi:hypothetical protein
MNEKLTEAIKKFRKEQGLPAEIVNDVEGDELNTKIQKYRLGMGLTAKMKDKSKK